MTKGYYLKARITIVPVIRPPKGLLAPLIALTVVREKLPVIGIELKENSIRDKQSNWKDKR